MTLIVSFGTTKEGGARIASPSFVTLIPTPPRLSEKSRREQKSPYPTAGATTNFQSSDVVIILLRQSPPVTA